VTDYLKTTIKRNYWLSVSFNPFNYDKDIMQKHMLRWITIIPLSNIWPSPGWTAHGF